jgi:hypothetical protein
MKTTRLRLLITSFAVESGALGQSISAQNPVTRDHVVTWPLAFQFDGSEPTIDVGNRPGLNPSTFTICTYGGCAYFNGVIDNVTLYPRALSASLIEALSTAINGDSHLPLRQRSLPKAAR